MILRRVSILLFATMIPCVASKDIQACPVRILVKNKSSYTITGIAYRLSDQHPWGVNLIKDDITINDTLELRWVSQGYQEIGIIDTTSTRPFVVKTKEICRNSQIIISQHNIVLQ